MKKDYTIIPSNPFVCLIFEVYISFLSRNQTTLLFCVSQLSFLESGLHSAARNPGYTDEKEEVVLESHTKWIPEGRAKGGICSSSSWIEPKVIVKLCCSWIRVSSQTIAGSSRSYCGTMRMFTTNAWGMVSVLCVFVLITRIVPWVDDDPSHITHPTRTDKDQDRIISGNNVCRIWALGVIVQGFSIVLSNNKLLRHYDKFN